MRVTPLVAIAESHESPEPRQSIEIWIVWPVASPTPMAAPDSLTPCIKVEFGQQGEGGESLQGAGRWPGPMGILRGENLPGSGIGKDPGLGENVWKRPGSWSEIGLGAGEI